MKKILLLSMLFISSVLSAQKVDSVKIDGTYYYVYPYPQETYPSSRLLLTLTPKDIAALRAEGDWSEVISNYYGEKETREGGKPTKKQVKYVRTNAEKFYGMYFDDKRDLVPALANLPNGKYVQYFEKYWKYNEKDELIVQKNKVAGYFTMKNNLPEGPALWVNMVGDTVKQGRFSNGVKEGVWNKANYVNDVRYDYDWNFVEWTSFKPFSTSKETYANGVLNGPYESLNDGSISERGFYKDGKKSGEWFIYSIKGNRHNGVWKDTSILIENYTLSDKSKISHKPYIRNAFVYGNLPEKYFVFPGYFDGVDFSYFWEFPKNKEAADLELPEEKIGSYDGAYYEGYNEFDEYDEEDYYGKDYFGENYDENIETMIWYDGKSIPRSKLIDSIGIINKYEGIYKEFWSNGKLKVKLEYKDGNLVFEDTIFWDNGKVADVIVYDPLTKEYENKKYDYTGVLYDVRIFDSLGDFKKHTLDPFYRDKHVLIDGFDTQLVEGFIESNNYEDMYSSSESNVWNHYEYDNLDTLKNQSLNGNVVLSKSWYGDKKPLKMSAYNADERILTAETRSLNGTLMGSSSYEFDEKFDHVRGTSFIHLKDLQLVNTFNGHYAGISSDSFPALRVENMFFYELTEDAVLKYKDEPFSGKFTLNLLQKTPAYAVSKNEIKLRFADNTSFYKKLKKEYSKFQKTGKTKYNDILSISTQLGMNYSSELMRMFPELNFMLASSLNPSYQENPNAMVSKKVEGQFINGKPAGTWKVIDTKGKVILECNFLNGSLHGLVKTYAYAKPIPKNKDEQEFYYDFAPQPSVYDTFPTKTVYYLSRKISTKNGLLDGDFIGYDWLGKITSKVSYVDGYQQGPASEHNSIASTFMTFKDGAADGIVKTFLHLPGKDSILLYELNFKDGALQGESRSYHTNGKLSKRGFFLNGMPIDDYEGYDSLGTRFHYIKFQYSFPVEEKIWEANQLSVRYQFDWRDSIYFRPNDITEATSVNQLLYKYGLLGNTYNQPYYGRPSLVEKAGINYHMTKYFPNDTVSRDGALSSGKKVGCWQFFSYEGEKLYEVEYFDTIIHFNDSIKFKSKGIYFDYDKAGNLLSKSYIIEKFEKYDCSHTDHYEVRQFYTTWQANDSMHRINGYVKNYYDNGTLQSEGVMKDGLPNGIWKYYDPFGKLNHVGEYKLGKRDGRWLSGDLSKSKYLGDICMNPNLPDLEEQMKYQEKMLDIYIRHFKMGKLIDSEYYDLNLNKYGQQEEYEESENEEMQFDPEEEEK